MNGCMDTEIRDRIRRLSFSKLLIIDEVMWGRSCSQFSVRNCFADAASPHSIQCGVAGAAALEDHYQLTELMQRHTGLRLTAHPPGSQVGTSTAA